MNPEFDPLLAIDAYLDGEFSPADRDSLRNWLEEDPAHADLLTERAFLHSRLSLIHAHRVDIPVEQAHPSQHFNTAALLNLFGRVLPEAIHPERHRAAFLVAASLLTVFFCGALVLMVWLPGGRKAGSEQAPTPFIATITHTDKAVWGKGQIGVQSGAQMLPGRQLELKTGFIHLLFRGGARVVVQGPAKLRIDSTEMMTLRKGRLLAQVSKRAMGFMVNTPNVDVVDLGTRFGLNVRERETEVQVFEGMIQARRVDDAEGQVRTLAAGEATVFGNSPQQGFYVKEKKMNRAIYLSLATVLAASAVQAPNGAESATIAYWQFEPGNLTLDSSGNGNALSNTGVTSSVDISPMAQGTGSANFSGSQTVFSTIGALDLSGETQLTIEWFAKSPQATTSLIFEHSPDQNSNVGAITGQLNPSFGPADSVGFTNPVSDGSYREATSTVSGGLNAWRHYAVLIDRSINNVGANDRIQMYLDGVLVGTDLDFSAPTSTATAFLNDILFIGSRNDTSVKYAGLLDELRISSGLLDPSEFLNVPPVVPEPASGALLGLGGMMVLGFARRRRRRV